MRRPAWSPSSPSAELLVGGGLFVMGDSAVKYIREDVDEDAFLSLVTAANMDVVNWGKIE